MTPRLSDFLNVDAAWSHVSEAKHFRQIAARMAMKGQASAAQLVRVEMRYHAKLAVNAARHECRKRSAAFTA